MDVTGECGPMLVQACKTGNKSFLQRILDANGDSIKNQIDFKDGIGYTGLHYAARGEHTELLEMLLEKGANPNVQNGTGETPLHKAVQTDNQACVVALCKYGADASIKDSKGKTPLMCAKSKVLQNAMKQINASQQEVKEHKFDDDDMFASDDDD